MTAISGISETRHLEKCLMFVSSCIYKGMFSTFVTVEALRLISPASFAVQKKIR
jgi:hypothetical protein